MASKWRTGVFLTVLIFTGLACSFLSGISNQGEEILTTAQSLATEIDSGEILGTVAVVIALVHLAAPSARLRKNGGSRHAGTRSCRGRASTRGDIGFVC